MKKNVKPKRSLRKPIVRNRAKVKTVPTSPTKERSDQASGIEPTSPSVGTLVRYYREGWYHGHVVEVTKKVIRVKPIGAIGSKRDSVKCALEDVEVVE